MILLRGEGKMRARGDQTLWPPVLCVIEFVQSSGVKKHRRVASQEASLTHLQTEREK
jgi:hypothetical protein